MRVCVCSQVWQQCITVTLHSPMCLPSRSLEARTEFNSKCIPYHTVPSTTIIIHWSWQWCVSLCVFLHCTVLCLHACVFGVCVTWLVFALCPHYVLQYWFLMARGWLPIDPSASINMLRWLMVCAHGVCLSVCMIQKRYNCTLMMEWLIGRVDRPSKIPV